MRQFTAARGSSDRGPTLWLYIFGAFFVALAPLLAQSEQGTVFLLVNAESGDAIRRIEDGDVIALSQLSARKLNIRAEFEPNVQTVVFHFDKMRDYRVESAPPFYIAGDIGGRPKQLVLRPGKHTIEVVARGAGQPVRTARVSFSIVENGKTTEGERAVPEATPSAEDRAARARLANEPVKVVPPEWKEPGSPRPEEVLRAAVETSDISPLSTEPTGPIRSERRNVIFKLMNPRGEEVEGQCVSFLGGEEWKATIACTHALPGPLSATIVLGNRTICELPVKAPPLIASCPFGPDAIRAFLEGALKLHLEGADGTRLSGWLR